MVAKLEPTFVLALDLDGTILPKGGSVPDSDFQALAGLDHQAHRYICTGRALQSALLSLPPDMPIDGLFFGSGIGFYDWHSKKVEAGRHLNAIQVRTVSQRALEFKWSYSFQGAVPDNHLTYFSVSMASAHEDFKRWIAAKGKHAFTCANFTESRYSQVLVIDDKKKIAQSFEEFNAPLPALSWIFTTSPIDGESQWLEGFAPGVNKGSSLIRFMKRHQIDVPIVAVGNDTNDLSLLEVARYPFVVEGVSTLSSFGYPRAGKCGCDVIQAVLRALSFHQRG